MNSVTPASPERIDKEGAGKGVVLFCCTLFFLFQLVTIIPRDLSPVSPTHELIATSPQSLKLVTPPEHKPSKNLSQSLSAGNYQFSPFFFEPVAINYCDKSLLMSIKGIGPSLAENIMATRDKRGGFKTAEDLLLVNGIGPGRLLQFTPYFDFSTDYDNE